MEKINVNQPFLPPLDEYIDKLKDIWANHWLTNNGKYHFEFEQKLKEYLSAYNISLFVNGHSALDIAIKALKLSGEVITTPFTFASTTHAIVQNGLQPVFCDINLQDYTIEVDKIEQLITDKTSAIIPVHVYGNPCDVKKIDKIANKYNLKVIYDAAHAFGVEVDGNPIGIFGDISMFSFHATKVFHSIEGGALSYKDISYKSLFDMYKNFGISGQEDIDIVGMNCKMNEFQAAMGLLNLNYIDAQISRRKKLVECYKNNLNSIKGIFYLSELEHVKYNYSYFPILVDEKIFGINRDALMDRLKLQGIFTRKYFYPLTNSFNCYKGIFDFYETPNAEYVSNRILTLPLYADLAVSDITNICKVIRSVKL